MMPASERRETADAMEIQVRHALALIVHIMLHYTCCVTAVELEVVNGPDDTPQRSTLSNTLTLKKEFQNARLVSADELIWVKDAKLTHKDIAAAAGSEQKDIREGRLEAKQRAFVFQFELTEHGLAFWKELKEQVTGTEVKQKKRKIRKQIVQDEVAGFVPVNTLKSPSKPPRTPTKLMTRILSPRISAPIGLSVASMPDAYAVSPSKSKSPFRSPFRKKPAPRDGASPIADNQDAQASPRPREWLSPARSALSRAERTPPVAKEDGTATELRAPHQQPEKRRVKSLQAMLDGVSDDKETPKKKSILSPYFRKAPLESDSPPLVSRTQLLAAARASDNSKGSPVTDVQPKSTPIKSTLSPSNENNATGTPAGESKKTHGLLNLGNYCYMNSIAQALASLPAFADSIDNDEWLVPLITQHLDKKYSEKEVRSAVQKWKAENAVTQLSLQTRLKDVLKLISEGSPTPINPEPLKLAMGKKIATFASLSQQDAHEFLVNLLTEYENELVTAVKQITEKIQSDVKPETKKAQSSGVLSFFRRLPDKAAESANAAKKAVETSHMLPAQYFRTEVIRTLTCTSCGYSRKQPETFHDFSLDMPPRPTPASPIPPAVSNSSSAIKCHCGVEAIICTRDAKRFYCCNNGACSLRDPVPEETTSPVPKLPKHSSNENSTDESSPGGLKQSPVSTLVQPLLLEDLVKSQFKSEILDLACEKCSGKKAEMTYDVAELPLVLVLHLKRFELNPLTGSLFKRSDLVEASPTFDPTTAFQPQCTSSAVSSSKHAIPTFTLQESVFSSFALPRQSIVHHLGKTIDEGHYVADVRTSDGNWVRRNDNLESSVSTPCAVT
ncbi:TPA: hypothetical protein N0F65_002885 [Lagenidium giganteum]|uniref:USP domain-containing protein n=1 Tax=Lagenidium giganteum TaxID=4803 RepID=A0AAV2ZDS7_9STRA|nr:TPA: hypothetical protein N0F65_002885 [Lagenidium giganteum]